MHAVLLAAPTKNAMAKPALCHNLKFENAASRSSGNSVPMIALKMVFHVASPTPYANADATSTAHASAWRAHACIAFQSHAVYATRKPSCAAVDTTTSR